MALSLPILIGWLVYIIIAYYCIYSISNILTRIILILILCLSLTYLTCHNLPVFHLSSLFIVAICWLTSIRLFHLIIFSKNNSLTFKSYLLKLLWIYFPIQTSTSVKNQWSIISSIILIIIKLLMSHWVHRWLINCDRGISFERIVMFYMSIMTTSYAVDIQVILIRILTRDKYTMESFTNFPIFSLSIREFWGRRYNKITNTILKQSIFEPLRSQFLSPTISALITFIISGLMHVHVAFVIFDDLSTLFPTFCFFFLHGIACCVEANTNMQFDDHVRWVLTHTFLLITAPLMIGPFIKEGSVFLKLNPPPLFDNEWIPKLPLPNFCP
ncbi:unnamed protein product [Adineta steineri]|uniref:Wax synthase domain-containing protein n=1 Tax=Adineta steineri TaxID=433720 RepID=A0A815QHW7_9BILA|nr:unnamed protein product [Adineta steineri]CAF1633637.1 unnamed protein product [Adineta steineri]